MALLFMDGFDHYATGNGTLVSTGKWGATSGISLATISTTSPRTGTAVLQCNSGSVTTKTFSTSGGAVVGFAFYCTTLGAGDLIQILESAITHVALAMTAGGLLTVKRGSTVLATGTTVLSLNSWYYLELKTVIHDSAGTTEVHIDGVTEAALTLTSQDTRNAGTGVWDRVVLTSPVNAFRYDDFYICDTSGSAPRNTFLGPIKVELLMPQTDAVDVGSNAGLTPSTGTDHGALVDEASPNTTDYNGSATVGAKDTYEYPAMTLTGTVYGVQTNLYVAKSDASARTVCPVVRTASTDADGTAISPTTTYQYYTQVWQQDPNAGSPIEWTTANIATMQAGMKVVS